MNTLDRSIQNGDKERRIETDSHSPSEDSNSPKNTYSGMCGLIYPRWRSYCPVDRIFMSINRDTKNPTYCSVGKLSHLSVLMKSN